LLRWKISIQYCRSRTGEGKITLQLLQTSFSLLKLHHAAAGAFPGRKFYTLIKWMLIPVQAEQLLHLLQR
jgi:hypothetical protein